VNLDFAFNGFWIVDAGLHAEKFDRRHLACAIVDRGVNSREAAGPALLDARIPRDRRGRRHVHHTILNGHAVTRNCEERVQFALKT
jgi:hypothetical protein